MSSHKVTVEESHKGIFTQTITDGRHTLTADVPSALGGNDSGPNPYDKLMSALGSCTSMTLRMYADVKKWPLEGVEVSLTHRKEKDPATGVVGDVITREITVKGALDDDQKARLIEIANKCPVHKTLESHPTVDTQLAPKTAADAFAATTPGPKPEKPRFSVQAAQALRAVTVASTGEGKFTQKVTAGGTTYNTDEPIELGGLDKGPNPYEELLSALGACTSMKMRRFAQENEYPLQHISVTLRHHKEKEADGKVVDKFQRDITLKGNLTDDQRQKLLDIANACPIHQTLLLGPKVVTVLANGGGKPAAAPPPAAPRI